MQALQVHRLHNPAARRSHAPLTARKSMAMPELQDSKFALNTAGSVVHKVVRSTEDTGTRRHIHHVSGSRPPSSCCCGGASASAVVNISGSPAAPDSSCSKRSVRAWSDSE